MKILVTALLIFANTTAFAEIWKKPAYVPDENHLPAPQEEQERPKKKEIKKEKKKIKSSWQKKSKNL